MDTATEFVSELVRTVPELSSRLSEHLSDYDELLPHVFMGAVTQFVMELNSQASKNPGANAADGLVVDRIVACLERGMKTGDERVQELIGVSFLENLDQTDPYYPVLRQRLGEKLRKELRFHETG